MAHINLLPWREEARERQKRTYLGILVLVFVASIFLVFLCLQLIDWITNEQRQRNQYLQGEINILVRKIGEIDSVKKRKNEIEQSTEVILKLQQARNLPTHILDELARIVPSGIYLSSIEKKGSILWLEGRSESNNHVSNMMRRVTNSNWLHQANMQSIVSKNEASRQLQYFNLSIGVKDANNELQPKIRKVGSE